MFKPDCKDGWCRVPAGTFTIGTPEDETECRGLHSEDQVQVTLTRSFTIQQFETTQAQWVAQGLDNPSGLIDGTGDCAEPQCPVGNVTWFETAHFANKVSAAHSPPFPPCYVLSGCTGKVGHGYSCATVALNAKTIYDCAGFRLPTQPEWEYAVRAGTPTAFYSGPITKQPDCGTCYPDTKLDPIGWYCGNAGPTTHPVGLKQPNALGLYDMSGNAYEWVNDAWHSGGYGVGPLTDPRGDLEPERPARAIRGGRFNIWPSACRSAAHSNFDWDWHAFGNGFRLVRTLGPKE